MRHFGVSVRAHKHCLSGRSRGKRIVPYDNGKCIYLLRLQVSNFVEVKDQCRSGSPWYSSPERTLIALFFDRIKD